MDVIHSEKKSFDQMTDKQLDDYILTDPPFMVNAVDERTRRVNKKLLELTRHLLFYTVALFFLTLVLLIVEIRGIFFAK
jgi:hypothetical protein